MSMICTKDSVSYGGVLSSFHDPSISQITQKAIRVFFLFRASPQRITAVETHFYALSRSHHPSGTAGRYPITRWLTKIDLDRSAQDTSLTYIYSIGQRCHDSSYKTAFSCARVTKEPCCVQWPDWRAEDNKRRRRRVAIRAAAAPHTKVTPQFRM